MDRRHGTRWAKIALAAAMGWASVAGVTARAQDAGGMGRGMFAGMQHAAGEVTAVVTTDNTRVMKTGPTHSMGDMTPIKVADVKVGDGVMAMGQLDAATKTLHAAMMFTTDAAEVKALKASWAKTYIAGKVTAVDLDNATMTVESPDQRTAKIGFDEGTSFVRGRGGRAGMAGMAGMMGGGAGAAQAGAGAESITLADVKVGDTVYGQGTVKGGVFVPGKLVVATPHEGGGHHEGPQGGPPAPPQ